MINYEDLTVSQQEAIEKVKKALYESLSYTNQSYEEILMDIVNLFTNTDKLNTPWNNISEADIMFIFMSLLSAHKDMLNYMIDYRSLESYMSTARERESMYRIAASFGFKVPSYKASKVNFRLTGGLDTINLNKFSSFTDNSGNVWSYLGDLSDPTYDIEETDTKALSDNIEMYQGNIYNLDNINPSNFNNKSKSHIVSNKSISIGNNFNNLGCSLLYASSGTDIIYFKEVENVYNYTNSTDSNKLEGDDQYVYELNVDPQGITYIKLPTNIDLESFTSGGYAFFFKYLVTSGATVTFADNIETEDYSLSPVTGTFVRGSNPPDRNRFKELFKNYYASADVLVTLSDYRNYVLNKQKSVLGITKCLVADNQSDTLGGSGAGGGSSPLEVGVYILTDENDPTEIDSGDISDLLEDLSSRSVSGISVEINSMGGAYTLSEKPLYIDIDGTITGEVEDIISEYILSKDIGSALTAKEISDELSRNNYDYYGKIYIGATASPTTSNPIELEFNEYFGLPTITDETS